MVMSLFGNLFGNKVMADFSVLKTDMHAHLIPGIDDGAAAISDTVGMIAGMQKLGFSNFITTPHVMKGVYDNSSETIIHEGNNLNAELLSKMNCTVHCAAEYYIDDEFPERIKQGASLLTFGDNCVLIEMSMAAKSKMLETAIFELSLRNYNPVLAHVERYPYLFEHQQLDAYQRLRDADVMLQVNIRSFAGAYGEIQKKIARKLAEHNMIDFLGTDIHNIAQLHSLQTAMHDSVVQQLLKSDTLKNKFL